MWENDIINYDLIICDYLTSDFGELAQLVVCSIRVDLLTKYKQALHMLNNKFPAN